MTAKGPGPAGPDQGRKNGRNGKEFSLPPAFDPAPSAEFAHRVLGAARASGALIGRIAVWAWVPDGSEHEITKDLDVAVSRADLRRVRDWLLQEGYKPRELPIGGVNVRREAPYVNVDFIERSQEGDLSALFEDAVQAAQSAGFSVKVAEGVEMPLVPAEHLIAMKLGSGRPEKDEKDVKRILRAVRELDIPRLRELVSRFLGPGVRNRLETILVEVAHPAARRGYEDS